MLNLVKGNLLAAEVEALVNTVNTEGVMGKGVALQFKKAFPENFEAYRRACVEGQVKPGEIFVFEMNRLHGPRYILNFPTKRHWRDRSKLDDIAAGLNDLVNKIDELQLKSIAVPPLGCGNGGLSWRTVYPLIEEALGTLDLDVLVYEPAGAPAAEQIVNATARPRMTEGRAAFMLVMEQYIATGWNYRLSLLELQKLAYFLQEAGQPLRLRFKPLIYGPYADELRHVLNRIEGHFVFGFADGKNQPDTPIQPVDEAIEEARQFAGKKVDLQHRLERVATLIENFETPFGMELLSSTHWVAVQGLGSTPARTSSEALRQLHAWNKRKAAMFGREHVQMSWSRLSDEHWVQV